MAFSKTQIDRLGERLKAGEPTDDDLRMLDDFRRSFSDAYDSVVAAIRYKLTIEPTGRPAKSTKSIVDKLRRESVRLSQIQDIAGCRLVVGDVLEQDAVVASLAGVLAVVTVVDRREKPSHGYRAVHLIADINGVLVEIQVRTQLQHRWAEVSEKLSDTLDISIKYGGGSEETQLTLTTLSAAIEDAEHFQRLVESSADAAAKANLLPAVNNLEGIIRNALQSIIEEAGRQP